MEEILSRVETAARGYPIKVQDKDWGEIEFRFDLPSEGASESDLGRARLAVGLSRLPSPFEALLKRWDGLRLFQIWKPNESSPVEEVRFNSTGFLTSVGQFAIQELDDDGRKGLVIASGYGFELLMEPDREWILIHQECVGRYFYLCGSLTEFLEAVLMDGPSKAPSWADRSSWKLI